jgi:hypothetical protein
VLHPALVSLFLVGVSIVSLVRGNPIETRDYMFFILGAFYLSFPFWFYKLLIKRMYKKSKFLHVPSEVEITSEQVSMTNELNSGIIKWPLFIKSAYNDKTLILMSTPRTMLIIPKRFVPTEAEWNELLQIVKEKVVVS